MYPPGLSAVSILVRRIDFSSAGTDDLEALYHACQPAEFGRNGENVLDDSYRKAGKMDPTSFSTLVDPHSLGIYDQVSKALLTQSFATKDMELYKLNIYGEKSAHEGGQLVLRHRDKEWTVDFTEKFMTKSEPSVCFIAFFGDIEHEVLPVTSGYRVTLAYNLYQWHAILADDTRGAAVLLVAPAVNAHTSLVDLVSDKSKLPNGGYLGFGLAHEYVHTSRKLLELLLGQLKGSDRVLADVCDALGLRYSLRLLYRGIVDQQLNLITTNELDVKHDPAVLVEDSTDKFHIMRALRGLGIEQVEGVDLIGSPWKFDPSLFEWDETVDNVGSPVFPDPESGKIREGCLDWVSTLRRIVREPVTQVLEVTPMASESVAINSPILRYGNEATLDFFYGTACMLIAVDPAKSRKPLVV
ncbi:hypothetical protein JVT61DRAFT_3504 [Boletus reticuloceps]|uniref:Fe2OG dioxygenase domain-containing protein n=1 Tax=Boletus reticuloceps TaxID=495285 RepID=A0A8I2YP36_9AGAM|nr:hypothetical protein JVT61DRAFT_3504 [Boletus reticuloceps]